MFRDEVHPFLKRTLKDVFKRWMNTGEKQQDANDCRPQLVATSAHSTFSSFLYV